MKSIQRQEICFLQQVGDEGAGHFVKMVHNGIEYGDMQVICEAYDLMKNCLGMTPDEIGKVRQKNLLKVFSAVKGKVTSFTLSSLILACFSLYLPIFVFIRHLRVAKQFPTSIKFTST